MKRYVCVQYTKIGYTWLVVMWPLRNTLTANINTALSKVYLFRFSLGTSENNKLIKKDDSDYKIS